MQADEPEPGTTAWTKWENARRGKQPPAEYEANVKAAEDEQATKLISGEAHARFTRRLDLDPATGAPTSSRRCGNGPWSRPRVVAVAPRAAVRAVATIAPRRAARGRARRPAARRSGQARPRAPDGDSDGSEGEPGPHRPGDQALADYLAGVFPEGLTPRAFHSALEPFALTGAERAAVLAALPDRLRRSFWGHVRAEKDADAPWAPLGGRGCAA